MKSCREPAVSEIVGTLLIISLIVVLTMVIMALFLGAPLMPKKPVLATFTAEKVMGVNVASPYNLDVPVIAIRQTAGDTLTQEYTTGIHGGINGTKIKFIDPAGKMLTVTQSVTMTAKTIGKGQPYYIFHRQVGEPNEYWITQDPTRIFSTSWGGVEPFSPHGTWKLIITDEKDTNMVLFSKDIIM
jgi:hypothetical protein